MHVYESHLGGLYFSTEALDWDDLYCDECGDCDRHLGYVNNWGQLVRLLQELDMDNYITDDLNAEFHVYM